MFASVSVEWKVDERQIEFQQSDVKRILEFSLEHAKIPKDKYKIIKISKKKNDSNKNDNNNDNKRSSLLLENTTDLGLNDTKKEKKDKKGKKDKSDDDDDSKSEDEDEENSEEDDDSDDESDNSEDDEDDEDDDDSDNSDSSQKKKKKSKNKKKGKKDKKKDKKEKSKKDKSKLDIELTANIDFENLSWEKEILKANKHFEKTDVEFSEKIKGLKDMTAYAVRIRARNSSGFGAYCQAQIFITPKLVLDSKIITDKETDIFINKILPKNLRNKKFKLLFRGSKDGFQAYSFHQKCDNKGSTIVLVQSSLNHVFGGYANCSWNSSNTYINDPKAFLFVLRSSRGYKPTKWNVSSTGNALYGYSSYGPTFGSGHDLYLCDNCNASNGNYSNLGTGYSAPKDTSLLAGAYNFTVKDFEVFQIF